MLLSAAIIVRDEAEHLGACLSSLAGLVDEIVVVDTGSIDASIAVARTHGALVTSKPWCGDFSMPRNRSLELASASWILYIDADERALPTHPQRLRNQLAAATTDHIAFRVRLVPRIGWTPYREYRLFRNHPEIRFDGVIHETVVPAIHAVADNEGLMIGDSDALTIEHVGYEGDQGEKHARNEPMLIAAIAERPDRTFLYDHLARIHEDRGDSVAAVAAWREGIEIARGREASHPDDRLVYIDLIWHLLMRGGNTNEIGALIAEALKHFPGIPSLELAAATHEFATGAAKPARARLEWITSLELDDVIATGSAYDERVLGEWSWNLLGLCCFELGDNRRAAEAFRHAEAAAPGNPAYTVRRRLAEARARASSPEE